MRVTLGVSYTSVKYFLWSIPARRPLTTNVALPQISYYRYPMQDREIQNGGKLTVRDSQAAVFVNEGTVADSFPPGLYTLNTQTLPILTYLKNWDKAFQSPFKSDVYFFSTRIQTNQH